LARWKTPLEAPHDLVLDGLFGGGLSRPLDGTAAQLAQRGGRVSQSMCLRASADCGQNRLGPCFVAEGTITFAALRPAHVLRPASAYCGNVLVADIGVPVQTRLMENSPMLWLRLLPQPGMADHKHSRGHLKVLSGGVSSTGRSAAGRACRPADRRRAGDFADAAIGADGQCQPADGRDGQACRRAEELSEAIQTASVVIAGPGAGITPATRPMWRRF
jgi:hypothetical protein